MEVLPVLIGEFSEIFGERNLSIKTCISTVYKSEF